VLIGYTEKERKRKTEMFETKEGGDKGGRALSFCWLEATMLGDPNVFGTDLEHEVLAMRGKKQESGRGEESGGGW